MHQPDILLITIDCLRPDHLGCYGYQRANTPCLDQLASQGTCFTQTISGGGWTMAAFPGILTSTYASMHNGCRTPLAPERPKLVTALRGAGYNTVGFVTNPLLYTLGYGDDFNNFFNAEYNHKPEWFRKKGIQKGALTLLRQPFVHQVLNWLGHPTRPGKVYVSANELTPTVCNYVESITSPFFIWVHYMDIHWPYFLEGNSVGPARLAREWQDSQIAYRAMSRHIGQPLDSIQREHMISLYDVALAEVDCQIEALLGVLKGRGDDNTHIVITADHGEAFGEHGYYGHDRIGLYDEIIRVPLLWSGPGVPANVVNDDLISLLDLAPTLLDVLEAPIPENMRGYSFKKALFGEPSNGRTITISESPWDWKTEFAVALRTSQYKFIHDNRKLNNPELYDLRTDPQEKANIADQLPDIVSEFEEPLQVHFRMVDASRNQLDEENSSKELLDRLRALGYVE
jgi:arylsulfatase A-like enzyme